MKVNTTRASFAVALSVAAWAAGGSAQAADVHVGVNIGAPAPVFVAPTPVYAPPPPPVIYAPGPMYAPPVVIGWHGNRYWDGRRYWSRGDWNRYHGYGHGYDHRHGNGHDHGHRNGHGHGHR